VALGLFRRSFKLGLVIAPVSVVGYCAGMLWGAQGAALGFSAALVLWAIPHLALTVRGTVVSLRDVLAQVQAPLLAATIATLAAAGAHYGLLLSHGPFVRLLVGASIFGIVYAFFLLYVMGHWSSYVDVWKTVLGQDRDGEPVAVDVAGPSSTPVARQGRRL